MAKTVEIDEQVTVGKLAELLSIPVSKLIAELFKNGVMATVNEKIDFDTAQIIVGELGEEVDVELKHREATAAPARPRREVSEGGTPRPPVVAMMGHVDHGKTSLLDAIRETETTAGEAGGITQHLSAYQIEHSGRLITFLDTPGHEAFAALREHGARLTDVAVIVIAADDGIKPQTLEAIRFARQAGVRIIVAANKMDKATDTQLNLLKGQLAENGLNPEDYGGDTIVIPVSAKTKEGVKELLDMILLAADIDELKGDGAGPAEGVVIEAHMEQGRGALAVVMIEHGTLNAGDFIAVGSTYGKARSLESTDGKKIQQAGPSTPVAITGLKNLPDFGDEFIVVENEKKARDLAVKTAGEKQADGSSAATSGSELLRMMNRSAKLSELNVVVKADVQGSLTSVVDSLKALNNEEVAVRVVSSGVGVISENDIHTASTTGAIIYGFNVDMPAAVKQLAARDKTQVRLYKVIYELLDDVKRELEDRLEPEIVEEVMGTLVVRGVFKTARTEVICGGEVTKGSLKLPALARLYHDKELVADNLEVTNLKSGPTDVTEVPEGEMCGLSFNTEKRLDVAEGDLLELFTRSQKTRTL